MLEIVKNGVGPAGAESVAAMAAVTGSLTKLDLRFNNIDSEGAAAIRKAVEGREGFALTGLPRLP